MVAESIAYEKALAFAKRVVGLSRHLNTDHQLSRYCAAEPVSVRILLRIVAESVEKILQRKSTLP